MHELAITQGILDIAVAKAGEIGAGKIYRVNVTIGELAGVVDDCVSFYFELLSKGTIAENAAISFDRPPTQLRCRECSAVFTPEGVDWACPGCRAQQFEIVSGRECYVNSIEVD